MDCPTGLTRHFYDTLVPQDPWKLVEFRKWILEACWDDPEIAREVWIICSRDLLFFINVFGWLLEPRDKAAWQPSRVFGGAREIPFVTRDYQNTDMVRMQSKLGTKDMSMLKSREMGATWAVLYLLYWSWCFESQMHYGVVSKDEDSAGNPDDPDSLLSKFDFIHDHMPEFLKPSRSWNKSKSTVRNLQNASTISAYACTGNMARGGRKRAFFCDEVHAWPINSDYSSMDSLQHVTNCRIIVSTPNRDRGMSGAFFDVIDNDLAELEKFVWHWTLDKDKRAGLYNTDGNTTEYLDPTYVYPADYKFVRIRKKFGRSPYYDYECRRSGATEQSIAAELDMDFGGATARFFQPWVIYKSRALTQDPTHWCQLSKLNGEWLPEIVECDQQTEINIELWIDPVSGLRFNSKGVLVVPEGRTYSMGIDVAQGTGGNFSSPSAFGILDKRTATQVAEFRYTRITPEDFAMLCYPVGMVFNCAIMGIEVSGGVGQAFLGKIMQLHYRNLWYRPASREDIRQNISRKVGYDYKDGGKILLGELQNALQRDAVKIRSKRTIDECERYYIDTSGNLKHPLVGKGRSNAPEKSHGDSAIALAMAWFSMHDEPAYEEEKPPEEEIPYGSFAWRQRQHSNSQKQTLRYWSPLGGN